jgi:tRNA dimethylallyltransferase
LAEAFHAEIISSDSRLFYRGMDIGTAKPTRAERDRVRHHLIDVSNPDETWSMAVFQQAVAAAMEDIQARGKIAMLVGGTGQYVHAVTQGWQPPDQEPDARLRAALEKWADSIGKKELHHKLGLLDPLAAERIDFRNMRRTLRALEVIFSSGQRFSDQTRKGECAYDLLQIGLIRPREELYARVDARIAAMLEQGLVAEVQGLLDLGYADNLPAFSAIGYCQIIDYLRGRCTLDEAVMMMKRLTRNFIRRQANWFSSDDPSIHWFHPDEEDQVRALVEAWLLSRRRER